MNREIKFKCYTKSDRDGSISMRIHKVTLMEYSVSAVSSQSTFSKIIGYCQYVGLKDKNGVEIYEGDIIACPYIDPIGGLHDEEDEDKRSFVMFVHGAFCLKYPHHHTPLVDWCHRTKGEYIPNYGNKTIISDTSPIEVIGNIYEHPELIATAATLEGGQKV